MMCFLVYTHIILKRYVLSAVNCGWGKDIKVVSFVAFFFYIFNNYMVSALWILTVWQCLVIEGE